VEHFIQSELVITAVWFSPLWLSSVFGIDYKYLDLLTYLLSQAVIVHVGTRRHKVLVSHDSSALLNELRREAAARDREARRLHMMEKRQSYELFMQSLQSWEDSLLEGQHLSAMWEVCQLVKC